MNFYIFSPPIKHYSSRDREDEGFLHKSQGQNLDRVPLIKKFLDPPRFDVQVILRFTDANLNLFEVLLRLGRPLLFQFFLLLVAELVIARDFCDWRGDLRGDFNKVKAFRLRESKRFVLFHHPQIFSGLIDHPEFG